MTNRVEQDQAKQAAEAERLQKRVEKDQRDAKSQQAGREAFGQVMKQQGAAKDAKAKGEKAQAEGQKGEAQAKQAQKGSADAERAARMARGGVLQHQKVAEQAKGFQGALEKTHQGTQQSDAGRVERRDTGKQKDRVEHEERERDVVVKAERKDAEVEQARVEAREKDRPNAAIDGERGGDSGGQQQRDDGNAAAIAAAKKMQGAPPVQQTAAKHEVKQIPPELLDKLVSSVWLGVNDKGLREFQIELKDGPLKGAFVKISSQDRKISLSFSGVEGNNKALLEASKGELMRRFEAKGLTLERLDVR